MTMQHRNVTSHAIHNSDNLRAEDGYRVQYRQRVRHTAILVPILIFAIIAILVLLMSRPGFGEAKTGRAVERTKHLPMQSILEFRSIR
jgi:predicted nucleic acid-binding Zn ribbon protein